VWYISFCPCRGIGHIAYTSFLVILFIDALSVEYFVKFERCENLIVNIE
jgi:hypothetical protein